MGWNQSAPVGPPQPAGPPARTGQVGPPTEVATGATSKAVPKTTGAKRPPPTMPEVKDETPQQTQNKAAPPARLPAEAVAQVEVAPTEKAAPSSGAATTLQQAASAPVPEQLEAVANAAKVLTAHGFSLTQAQE
eukprot:1977777-Amphidinium_carterae.1